MAIVEGLKEQFERGWKMIEATVDQFPDDQWRTAGKGYLNPARLAYHAVETVDFYISDLEEFPFGARFGGGWEELPADKLPSRAEVLTYLVEVRQKMREWLDRFDDQSIQAENTRHPWCGSTMHGFALYVLRHSLHHHGEINALLVLAGTEKDNWA